MHKPSVCVDLDGVLCFYDGWKGIEQIGEPIAGAVEFTKELAKFARIIIYTTRCKEFLGLGKPPTPPGATEPDRRPVIELREIVHQHLQKYGFVYDEIYIGQGKPFAICYIDDRSVVCQPQEYQDSSFSFQWALQEAMGFAGKLKAKDVSTSIVGDK